LQRQFIGLGRIGKVVALTGQAVAIGRGNTPDEIAGDQVDMCRLRGNDSNFLGACQRNCAKQNAGNDE